MLDQLLEESVSHLEDEFYSKPFHFSYSSISKLLYSPAVFYQLYVMGHKEERTEKHLIEGSVIHCLLLEPENFDYQFIVSPATIPTDKAKYLVDSVYYKVKGIMGDTPEIGFEDCSTYILETLQDMNYYQALKKDEDRLSKVITPETRSYFDFLKVKGTKTIIDQDSYKYCSDAVDIIKSTPGIMELLGKTDPLSVDGSNFNMEVYNELPLQVSMGKYSFGLKGVIDNLVIDHTHKQIRINDFKTSGKELSGFKESVEYYNYWMQAVIYLLMVSHSYKDLLEQGYTIDFRFIVIDRYFNVYAFPVSEDSKMNWLEKFNAVLKQVDYHYTQKRYALPYQFDNNLVVL
jgi:hypothetical protein